MRVLRSLLFVPGNQPRMLEKALQLTPDAFVPDMEDSVPAEEKANARTVVASFISRLSETGRPVVPRVNSLDTGLIADDLEVVVGPDIFGVSVGKVRSSDDIEEVSRILEALEGKVGLEAGRIKLIPWVETAMAVVNAYSICAASRRVVAVAFGAEDFTNDMGVEHQGDDSVLAYPRSVTGVAARAAGVLALDTPYIGYKDPEGLRRDAGTARKFGFQGKFAIHPAQIGVINEVFSASAAEIEHARRVVAAAEEAERGGRGSTSLHGQAIDAPVVERARSLLEMAEAISALDAEEG